MELELLNLIADRLYLEENFWGERSRQDQNTQTHYLEKARHLVELLENLGFTIAMGGQNDNRGQRIGGAPHQD